MSGRFLVLALASCLSLAGYADGGEHNKGAAPTDSQAEVQREVEGTVRSFLSGFALATCTDPTPVSKFARDPMLYVLEKDVVTVSLQDYEEGVRSRACSWTSHTGGVDSVVVDALSRDIAVAAWTYHDEIQLKTGEALKTTGAVLMTLVRTADGWKITSTKSSEIHPPSERASMDDSRLKEFGTKYTAAWCSQNAASVAAFFAESGSLKINDAAPSVGRTAIAEAAQGFMTAFPDMVVAMDAVSGDRDHATYRWTLTGTNTGTGGTGKAVRISGHEEWTLGADGLIAESQGHFDEADYQRQLNAGTGRR